MKKQEQRLRRAKRVRRKIQGTKAIPRLSVFRSNRLIYAQLIDDQAGITLIGASLKNLDDKDTKGTRTETARKLGFFIAKKALEKDIKKAVFDRGGYAYHGRVKAIAQGAREAGLKL